MSYIHPGYAEHLSMHPMYPVAYWKAYNPEWDALYYAQEDRSGWFSVDAEEWYGEFPSREAAETYLKLKFIEVDTLSEK